MTSRSHDIQCTGCGNLLQEAAEVIDDFVATQATGKYSAMVFFSLFVSIPEDISLDRASFTQITLVKEEHVRKGISTTFVAMYSFQDHRFLRGSLASLYSFPLGAEFVLVAATPAPSALVPLMVASPDCAVTLFLRRRMHSKAYCNCCCCCSCRVWAIGVLPSGTSSAAYLSFSCSMLISACPTCSPSSLMASRSSYQTLRTSSLISGPSPFSSCRTILGRLIGRKVGVEA